MEKLTNIIEAILFASGDAVPIELLREKLNITKRQADQAIHQLEKKYTGDCGIRLLTFNHKVQFATNPDYKESVSSVLTPIREKEFTRTILECSAIIAYKQPITRSELEAVRGMNSDYAISTLLSLDMIYPCGRRETPGKPVEYATTDNFLKRFKLKSIKELPDYEEFLRKLAELNSWEALKPAEDEGYLYEKDVYVPEEEEENANEQNNAEPSDDEIEFPEDEDTEE